MNLIEKKFSPRLAAMVRGPSLDDQAVLIYGACHSCGDQLRRRGVHIAHELPIVGGYAATVPLRLLPVLATKGYVRYMEPDLPVHLCMDRAARTVHAPEMRLGGHGGAGVTIAAIDTGLAPHRDFLQPRNRIRAFVDLVEERQEPYDDNGHGTFCLSCAAGSGASSGGKYCGIAGEADLVMVKAMDRNGGGTISAILRAMQWVSDHRDEHQIRVLSMSLGLEPGMLDPAFDALAMAAQALWRQGVVVVAAAGNSGPRVGTINSPGSAESVITVGAVDDRADPIGIAPFSSRGLPEQHKPELVAPGVSLTAADATGEGYRVLSGTSFSAPIVAGCAALLLEKNPQWTPDEVKQALLNGALDLHFAANAQGKGLVQLAPDTP